MRKRTVEPELPSSELTVPRGPCWTCGVAATMRCDWPTGAGSLDAPRCNHWVCDEHLVIEAQAWDRQAWDGVDCRCQEHRNLTDAVQDWWRGSAIPPVTRQSAPGLGGKGETHGTA